MLGAFYEDRTFIFDTAQQGVNISFVGLIPSAAVRGDRVHL